MNNLRQFWGNTKSSLWFVPTLMVAVAIALAVGLIEAEGLVSREMLGGYPRLFGAGADGARGMLTAIAGSMITVAGLTFSLTIVAITQASSQYTPRVLRNFIRSRPNQFVLGYFVSVFAYCIIVLRTIRGGDEGRFIPSLAVFCGLLFALLSVAVLVYFVHHTASSIQASNIISRVAKETVETIEQMFPGKHAGESEKDSGDMPACEISASEWRTIAAAKTGYIQSVDMKRLTELADERDMVLNMEEGTGGYIVKGAPLISYIANDAGDAEMDDDALAGKLNACYTFDHFRTIDQDAAFGIRQLVDITLRALSPGINDTTTAIVCIDYLSAILAECAARHMENHRRGRNGRVRVIACRPTFAGLVAEAFDQIRDSGEDNAAVLLRQLKAIETIGAHTPHAARRQVLSAQIELIADATGRSIDSAYNRARINERIVRVRAGLDRSDDAQLHAPGSRSSNRQAQRH